VIAASWPRAQREEERLLHIDPAASTFRDARVGDLPALLRAGDLLVVNDAATLPASLRGTARSGVAVELRLISRAASGEWTALIFGAGDWRTRTEDRELSPRLSWEGERSEEIQFRGGLSARVRKSSSRIVEVTFDREGAAFWSALYCAGEPVQYAYIERPLAAWHVQTSYASRPWAAEMPSAGRPLTWSVLLDLTRRGIRLASITHAAGLSSTGEASLDETLPLTERFEIPAATVALVKETKLAGGRVVATGTTVVRALEGSAALRGGQLRPGEGETNLLIGPGFRPRIVSGLFTGMHEPTASHFALLQAFAPLDLLRRAYELAERTGYLGHEFGDSNLIL
jgi:S-adenosylmethionine:tRNA ribosyltransferase-isomerase